MTNHSKKGGAVVPPSDFQIGQPKTPVNKGDDSNFSHGCAHADATHMRRIDQALRLLKAYDKFCNMTIAYSGGKDSDVCLHLCRLAHIKVDVVHNVSTIDPPGTISHCIEMGAQLNHPRETFFQLMRKKGLPSMFRRFCCAKLKERYIAPHVIMGIRSAESVKRAKRYHEPSDCILYNSKLRTEKILPIVNWLDDDIAWFVNQENIKCHHDYYVNGVFDATKRLGCIGCPLQSDRGKADFLKYPKFLRLWCRSYADYVSTHKAVDGVYEDIMYHLFYSNHGERKYEQTFHGLFAPPSAKEFLEDYFHIDL